MKRILRPVTGLLIIAVCLFPARGPILQAIGSFLVVQDELKPVDVIIVLSGDSGRVGEAARLYKKGLAGHLIMSGSSSDGKARLAAAMKRQAVSLGVPQESIIPEPQAQSTYQHPGLVKPIMRARGFKSAIVVSSPYHMRRSAMLFNRAFKNSGIKLIYYPAQESWFEVGEWWKSAASRRAVLLEYMKLAVNVFGNRVSEWVGKMVKDK